MTKAPIGLQELRRRIYRKAKAEVAWRFWGLYVHVCKLETLREASFRILCFKHFAFFLSGSCPRHRLPTAGMLRGKALPFETDVLAALQVITTLAPFRHMTTPGGFVMSVAMTNCGAAGWVTDRTGYRYDRFDPESGRPWPLLPKCFLELAIGAAAEAGYSNFVPDACLINRYEPGARLTLHQDKNEQDYTFPIVSVSLGLPAIFQFGGLKHADPIQKYALHHGDVAIWGGPSRLCYHGLLALKDGEHPKLRRTRLNLTFRRAL